MKQRMSLKKKDRLPSKIVSIDVVSVCVYRSKIFINVSSAIDN